MGSERIKLEALQQHVPLTPHFDTPSFGSALWPYMLLFRPYRAPDFVALQTAYARTCLWSGSVSRCRDQIPIHPLQNELAHLRQFYVGAIEQLYPEVRFLPLLPV